MLGIVLPVAVAIGRPICCSIEVLIAVNVGIAVSYEVVVVIDVDVVVAAPPTVVAPAAAPSRAHCDADAERNCRARRVISRRRISNWRVRISGHAIHDGWVVAGNVDNLWIGLLNNNHLFVLDCFRFHFLLFRGL